MGGRSMRGGRLFREKAREMNMIGFATDLPPPEEPATSAARCGQVLYLTMTSEWLCQCHDAELPAVHRAAQLAMTPCELKLRRSFRISILDRRTV